MSPAERPRADRATTLPTAAAVVAVVAVVAVLTAAWWFKAHCVVGDGWWQGTEQYVVGCYSDVVALWRDRGLVGGAVPYLESPVEYPVLTGAQMLGAAGVVRAFFGAGDRVFAFLTVTTAFNALCILATIWTLRRMGVVRDARWWAAAAVPVVLYTAHNWDPAAVLLLTAALALHVRGRDGLSGLAAGLGTAAKLFPGIVIPLVAGWHLVHRRWRAAAVHAGAAAGIWIAVNLPVFLAAPDNWWRFYTLSRERGPTFASTWGVVERVSGWVPDVALRNTLATTVFVVGALVVVAVGWRRHADRPYVLALPLLIWFLLTNKVWSPQFDLWLVPLMLIALPQLRQFLAFVVADVAVYVTEFGHLALRLGADGIPYWMLAVAATLRIAVLCWILVSCLRQPSPAPPPVSTTKRSPTPHTLPATGAAQP